MTNILFIVFLIGFWLVSYFLQWSLVWPAVISGIWVIGRIRERNIAHTRDKKAHQIVLCAKDKGVPEAFVESYFTKQEWCSRDSYNDVHPGRVADQLANEFRETQQG